MIIYHPCFFYSLWSENQIQQAEFSRVTNNDFGNSMGQLLGHELSKMGFADGVIFKVLQILYLDDGAFIFSSREDLIKGVTLINSLFKTFGLEMHIGRNNKASKTECIFFPLLVFFDQPSIQNNLNTPPMITETPTKDAPTENPRIGESTSQAIVEQQKEKKRRKKKKLYKTNGQGPKRRLTLRSNCRDKESHNWRWLH